MNIMLTKPRKRTNEWKGFEISQQQKIEEKETEAWKSH